MRKRTLRHYGVMHFPFLRIRPIRKLVLRAFDGPKRLRRLHAVLSISRSVLCLPWRRSASRCAVLARPRRPEIRSRRIKPGACRHVRT